MTYAELIANRYSVRAYKQIPVEQEKLDKILEAGRIAPTAGNKQPHRIKLITGEKELALVDESTKCRFGAPAVLLICYDRELVWKRPFDGALSGDVDVAIVTTHMMLQAHDLGLGTCWVMFFDPAKTAEVFALPDNIVPVAFLPLGYPAEDAAPSPKHTDRLALHSILL